MVLMNSRVFQLPMDHPSDVSSLERLIACGAVQAIDVCAIIGKTEGNGGVNDFTRGFFTQTLMMMLSRYTGATREQLLARIPCILSGGTEGVLSPHYVVLCRNSLPSVSTGDSKSLAIGTGMSEPLPAEDVGREPHVHSVAALVRKAITDARIVSDADVHFVQVKCPCVTTRRAQEARDRGKTLDVTDPNRSMAQSRIAGAVGVAVALGELACDDITEALQSRAFSKFSTRASISSGVEVEANEVIVLGNSPHWSGNLEIAHRPMRDALDIAAVCLVLGDLGIAAAPQVSMSDIARIKATFVKCEPDRRGSIRGHRHTMLDDTDINAQRHVRGAVGGLVAGVIGDTRIFVSGGAELQGPDGGGLMAMIADRRPVGLGDACAS